MRKLLLAATILVPFAIAPAFAGGGQQGLIAAGDFNLAGTMAGSNATVGSMQGTNAQAKVAGNGAVIVGAVSGNYTSVETTAAATAGRKGSATDTTATQMNVGGTLAGGLALNKNANNSGGGITDSAITTTAKGASGSAGGMQGSTAGGSSVAAAGNMNLGGFLKVPTKTGHTSR